MQIRHKALIFFVIACLVTSCSSLRRASAPPDNIKARESAFVYGFVEAQDDSIDRVDFVEYGKVYVPPFNKPPRVLVFDNGIFMAENIQPGKYVISGFRSERNHYNIVRSRRHAYQRVIRIMPGEMQYLGAFNVRVTKKGKIEFGKFEVTELQRPGERDVLKHLYRVTEGTSWQDKISRRLKELRQF